MGAFGGVLDILERSLGHLRWNLGHLGRVLERLGGIWGQFGELLGLIFGGFEGPKSVQKLV